MAKLNDLSKITKTKKKRIGRGAGSGRGKTAGRGTKGQKSRGKIPATLGVGGVAFLRRLPLYRGKYRNKPKKGKPIVVNLKYLNILSKNSEVTVEVLIANQIVDEKMAKLLGVKILGDGEIKVPLIVKIPSSKSAATKILKAGGKVEYELTNKNQATNPPAPPRTGPAGGQERNKK